MTLDVGICCFYVSDFCTKGNEKILAHKQTKEVSKNIVNVVWSDRAQCPDDNTCCKSSSGGYECCPVIDGTCCSDGIHCCPFGFSCTGGIMSWILFTK